MNVLAVQRALLLYYTLVGRVKLGENPMCLHFLSEFIMHEIEQQLVIFFSFADLGYFDCCDIRYIFIN